MSNKTSNLEGVPSALRKHRAQKGAETRKIASGKKKTLQETFKSILDMECSDKEKKALTKMGLNPEEIAFTKKSIMALSCVNSAIRSGDSKAVAKIGEMMGEYTPKQEIGGNISETRVVRMMPFDAKKVADRH